MRAKSNAIFILFVSLTASWIAKGVCHYHEEEYGLKKNFYRKSCPQAEKIVKDTIAEKVCDNLALGAKLLRVHYHDCFVRGCDASILLDTVNNTQSEKEAAPNRSLQGYEVIDEIKDKIEEVCPGIVSCADIVALAARDSVSFPYRIPLWEVPTGRRDGRISLASEVNANVPSPFSNFTTLLKLFESKGFNINDLVILSGAHTIGVSHCGPFSRRLYNFTGKGDQDPSMDPTYAESLKKQCPNQANSTTTVEMDPHSSSIFDSHYHLNLLKNKGLFQSDSALLTNRTAAWMVRKLVIKNSFLPEFAYSVKKMGAVGVLTGNEGEIRRKCRFVN